jgi:hypothetical protein
MVLHFQNVTITMVTSKFLGHSSRQGRHLLSFKLQKVWNICPLDNAPSTKLSSILCPYIIMLLKKFISRYTKHCFSRCKCKLIVTILFLMSSWNANINEDDIFLINLKMKIFNYPPWKTGILCYRKQLFLKHTFCIFSTNFKVIFNSCRTGLYNFL